MTLNDILGHMLATLGESTVPDMITVKRLLEASLREVWNYLARDKATARFLIREAMITVGEGEAILAFPEPVRWLYSAHVKNTSDSDDSYVELAIKDVDDRHMGVSPLLQGFPKHVYMAPSGEWRLWPVPDTTYDVYTRYIPAPPGVPEEFPNDDIDIPDEFSEMVIHSLTYKYAFARREQYGNILKILEDKKEEAFRNMRFELVQRGGKSHVKRTRGPLLPPGGEI